jgi:hypothetical protein
MPTYNGYKDQNGKTRLVARNWTQEQVDRHKTRAGYSGIKWAPIIEANTTPVGVKKAKPEPEPETKQEGAQDAQGE